MFHMPQKHVLKLELSINNTDIEKVNTFKFLSLTLDTNLKWKTHTQNIASKICQINGILKRMKYIFPQRVLLIIYNSLIEAYINYRLLLWGKSPGRVISLQKEHYAQSLY